LAVMRAHQRGVKIIVSNADHADVRTLYIGKFSLYALPRNNVIASKSHHRGEITEMVASNVL